MKPCIIMRACNDMPVIEQTLAMLKRQDMDFELIVFDNASTDGSLELIKEYADQVFHVPKGCYVPGQVLNQAMRYSTGEIVVFLNSDCTPLSPGWLRTLVSGFDSDDTAAVFGRQVPRRDCHVLHAKDTEDTYGEGDLQQRWRHCFSMAASAIRRSVWERRPFDEDLKYSEDIEWTWWARQQGYRINYVAGSAVMHSHNYTIRQSYRRQYGEGCAEAAIFSWSRWQRSFPRYVLLPCARRIINDWRYCFSQGYIYEAVYAPVLRISQYLGRWSGLRAGLS